MNDIERILREHAARYPKMQPQDAVKLVYQNEFGGGHLIVTRASALNRLLYEYVATSQRCDVALYEPIGNGLCRANLCALDFFKVAPEAIFEEFFASAQATRGSIDAFMEKLDLLSLAAREGAFSFSEAALAEYLKEYIKIGLPAVSHSNVYRAAYSPAYRIVRSEKLPAR